MKANRKKSVIANELAAIAQQFMLSEGEMFEKMQNKIAKKNQISSGIDLKDLFIKPTRMTPQIEFNANGEFWIKGSWSSTDFYSFFSPVDNWLQHYYLLPAECTEVSIMLRYLCPDDAKGLFHHFLVRLYLLEKNGFKIVINWYYEIDDEDMMETARIFSEALRKPINMYPVETIKSNYQF